MALGGTETGGMGTYRWSSDPPSPHFLAMIPTLLDFLVLRNGKASVDSLEACADMAGSPGLGRMPALLLANVFALWASCPSSPSFS